MNTIDKKIAAQTLAAYGVETEKPVVTRRTATPVARRSGTSFEDVADPLAIPDFMKRSHPFTYGNVGGQLEAIGRSIQTGERYAYIKDEAFDELVSLLHRTFGDTMEKAGIVWTGDGSAVAKAMIADFVEDSFFSDGTRSYPITVGEPSSDFFDDNIEDLFGGGDDE